MRKPSLFNFVIVSLWLTSAVAVLVRVYSLQFNAPKGWFLFWIPYLVLISTSALLVLTGESYSPLYTTLILAFILNLISKVRAPIDSIWGVDPPFHMQVGSSIVNTGYLVFEKGFYGEAASYSLYPGLDILLSNLHLLSGIPLKLIYQFTFTFMNLITILFLFVTMRAMLMRARIPIELFKTES